MSSPSASAPCSPRSRPARRQPRRVLREAPLRPPRRLELRRAARLLAATSGGSSTTSRTTRTRTSTATTTTSSQDAVRPSSAGAARRALVPPPALLHLAAVRPDGAALAVRRRLRALVQRPYRPEHVPPPRGWALVGTVSRQADLHRLGHRHPAARLPVVGRRGRVRRRRVVAASSSRSTFQLAHCVEEAAFATPEESARSRRVWAVHEVESTVDFCPRNPVADVGARRAQLPDRAPPVPARPAHALPAHRAASCGARRRGTASATRCSRRLRRRSARTSGTSAGWAGRPAGRDRDGLTATRR